MGRERGEGVVVFASKGKMDDRRRKVGDRGVELLAESKMREGRGKRVCCLVVVPHEGQVGKGEGKRGY